MKSFLITFLHRNINYRRKTAAISRRKSSFHQLDMIYRIRIKRREKSIQVGRIVNGDTIEKKEILIRPATSHVHASTSFVSALNSGQQLKNLHYVCLAHERR